MRRTVLISGGARGIGAAIAKRFEQEGHVVLKPSRAELDLANADSLEAFLLREGSQPIDVLINNAGINILNPIAAYSMTKAALNAFTRSLTVEYARFGILANTLCPGYVDSALTRQNNTPQEIEAVGATIPLRRLAQAEEIARIAYFLGSSENTYIAGQEIVADGGYLCQ
jgi:3-oxoacyl-[acyl-carrier protein] reductase